MISRWIGKKLILFFQEVGRLWLLLVQLIGATGYLLKRMDLVLWQMRTIGVNSLPLIGVVSVFTGAVTAWQAVYQFNGVMPEGMTLDFLGAAVNAAILIELSPVLAGIVIAGRVGASIAAELGTMKVTEQIDALETLAIDPVKYLAGPRFVAGWTMMPILVIYSNIIAHIGAFVVARFMVGLSSPMFFGSIQRYFNAYNVYSGLIKAFIFGGGTALIGCSIGFNTEGGAEGVGKSTIKAFVFSSAFILIADYVLAMILF